MSISERLLWTSLFTKTNLILLRFLCYYPRHFLSSYLVEHLFLLPLLTCDVGALLTTLAVRSRRPLTPLSTPLVDGSLKGLWGERLLTVRLRGSSPGGGADHPSMSEIVWGVGCLGGFA